MVRLVSLCAVSELPRAGALRCFLSEGREVCVANLNGRYAAVDNICPHRGGPLAEGSIEDGSVLCPWHAWAFSLSTGCAAQEPGQAVEVFPLEIVGDQVLVRLDIGSSGERT